MVAHIKFFALFFKLALLVITSVGNLTNMSFDLNVVINIYFLDHWIILIKESEFDRFILKEYFSVKIRIN